MKSCSSFDLEVAAFGRDGEAGQPSADEATRARLHAAQCRRCARELAWLEVEQRLLADRPEPRPMPDFGDVLARAFPADGAAFSHVPLQTAVEARDELARPVERWAVPAAESSPPLRSVAPSRLGAWHGRVVTYASLAAGAVGLLVSLRQNPVRFADGRGRAVTQAARQSPLPSPDCGDQMSSGDANDASCDLLSGKSVDAKAVARQARPLEPLQQSSEAGAGPLAEAEPVCTFDAAAGPPARGELACEAPGLFSHGAPAHRDDPR